MNIITLGIPGGVAPIITSGLLGAAVPPIPPVPPVVVTQAHGGAVGSSSFGEWLASRPIMGRAFRKPRQEVVIPIVDVPLLDHALQENQRRAALLMALLMLEEDDTL